MQKMDYIKITDTNPRIVTVPNTLRDNNWTESIGHIQHALDALSVGKHQVVFDFTKARWVDPLPLLSLLIEIVSLKNRNIDVQVIFPSRNESNPSSNESDKAVHACPNRVLLYYAKEGFFNALLDSSIHATIGENTLSAQEIEACEGLNVKPAYANSSFLPFKILDIPRIKNINEHFHSDEYAYCSRKVEEILTGVEVTLHAKCSSKERRHLIYTLSTVIQEFIHNVQEHAYNEGDSCLAAIYVRHRYGKLEVCSHAGQQIYDECTRLEKNNCKLINTEWLNNKRGCLEVFFLDRGQGILQKFSALDSGNSFRSVIHGTFLDGKSTKKNRRTQNGGLYTLHELMKRSHDYLRALNKNTWFGSAVPLNRDNSRTIGHLESHNEIDFKGLAYHLRLSWQTPTDNEDSWHRFSPDEKSTIRNEFCKPYSECKGFLSVFDKQLVVDERFNESPNIDTNKVDVDYVLWLPKRGKMKWDILSGLEDISDRLSKSCCLVIADIPCMEAAMYEASMGESNFGRREMWPNRFTKILLATNRWTFASAIHVIKNTSTGAHGFTTLRTDNMPDDFTSSWGKIIPIGYSLRQMIIYWLKYHESKLFWNIVTTDNRLFLPETVIWSDDNEHIPTKIIHGYLDFPATTHNKQCAQLYRLALARALELASSVECFLEPVDRLAEPVINDLYSQEIYEFQKTDRRSADKLAVGSVLVSGITLDATDNNQNNIHFFVHNEVHEVTETNKDKEIVSTKKISLFESHPSLFFWIPNISVDQSARPKQQRIGKTSAIAPRGWLSIEIPRADKTLREKNGKLENSYAFHSDEDSYIDWQNISPTIAKFGHWHYEGNHDLVTLNISDAVEDAFNRRNHLAKFLIQHLLHPLGIDTDKIKYFDGIKKIKNDLSIIIYRSHPSSERIIDTLLSSLDDEQRNQLAQWIFPILPLRQRWGGSTLLIPPREREKIKAALQHRQTAIIFDDAAISGRTIQDLQTTLKDLNAEKTEVTVIVNRLRLPSESRKINYFWRLDIPTMGKQGVCPWCHSLNVAKSLANKMVADTKEHQDIKSWIEKWSKANTINEWHKGLEPIQLKQRLYKNFTYRCDGNNENGNHTQRVPIYRSIGLIIHALQIHAMTASDDYGLRKIRETSQEPEIKIEIAVSQLMLFGDELDTNLICCFIVEGLLGPMAEDNCNTTHGQIAVLTLMHLLLTSSSDQLHQYIIAKTRFFSGELNNFSHGRIYLAFLVSEILKKSGNPDNEFHAGRRLLSMKHSNRAETLRAFIREMENAAGNVHSEPLPNLINELKTTTTISGKMLFAAETSIFKLKDIIQELGYDLAAASDTGENSYVECRKGIESALEKTLICLEAYSKASTGELNAGMAKQELIKSLDCVTARFSEFAKFYFHTVETNEPKGKYSFKRELSKIWENIDWVNLKKVKKIQHFEGNPIIKHSQESCICADFEKSMVQARILWHAPVRNIIRDLIFNVAYPVRDNKLIVDPWGDASSIEMAHMWINISYTKDYACIFLSSYAENSSGIFDEIKGKKRWGTLTDFSGYLKHNIEHSRNSVLTIEIYLPYASKLGIFTPLGE